MKTAVLLIAHGSRREEANADLRRTAEALDLRMPERLVETAYLELEPPTIPEGLARCRDQGASEIRMTPYFLSAGAHVMTDLSRFRDAFAVENPDILVKLCPPLGGHPLMIDILLQRVEETLGADGEISSDLEESREEHATP
jgi:sirohydrochlorin ferrochelatase